MGLHTPRIHDITTDFADPPRFVTLQVRPYPQGGRRVPELQRAAYPSLAPIVVDVPSVTAFDAAVAAARELGWEIAREDVQAGELEAVATTRWLRFKDDVAVRVRPTDIGCVVDLRSVSRIGQSDFGANARRIRNFTKVLAVRLSSGVSSP